MGAPRILVLQHHALEHPGVLTAALERHGARLDIVRAYDGDACPATLACHDGLLVMGGPMSVGDEYRWLADERALLARAIAADTPTLGICLGSQLIAAVAGADVQRGPVAEIGWHRIELTDAGRIDPLFADSLPTFAALEWHQDVFPLPPGATALAASARYPVQAFRIGRHVYGTLFHLEVTTPMVESWSQAFDDGRPLPTGDAGPDYAAANARAITLAERLFCGR